MGVRSALDASADAVAPLAALLRQTDPGEHVAVRSLLGTMRARMLGSTVVPVKLGRYVVGRPLGAGGEGVVYEGYDPRLDRQVALKLLHAPAQENLAEMGREARAMARLNDVHVVSVYDVGQTDPADHPRGAWFVVMELVEGKTLAQWLQDDPRRPWADVLQTVLQAGRGLASAHRQGLVHRDFKPSNVLVGDDGVVRVSDFGLAALTGATSTPCGGTKAYMAPEGGPDQIVDARSDQYAFCVVLWLALFGHRPGEPPPRDWARTVPARLARVLRRGLQADPRRRYPDVPALVNALQRAARSVHYRRWGVRGGLVLGAFGGLWALEAHRQANACRPQGAPMSGVWDPALRDALQARLDSQRGGDQARRYVLDRLDTHTAAWLATRKQVCELERRGALEPKLHAGALACLAQNRAQLRGVVELLATQDLAGSEAEAAGVVAPPAGCLEPEEAALALKHSQPPQAIAELAVVRARIAAGQLREAADEADVLSQRFDSETEPLLKAQALTLWARALGELDQPAHAEKIYRRAILLAERHESTPRALLARAGLAKVLAFTPAHHEEARHAVKLIAARLRRDPPAEFLLADAWTLVGQTYNQLRNPKAALDAYDNAERAYIGTVGADHPSVARASAGRAIALCSLRRFSEAQELARASLARTVRHKGGRHASVGFALHVLGGALFFDRQPASALAYMRRSHAIYSEQLGKGHAQTLIVGRNLGVALMATGRLSESIHVLTQTEAQRRLEAGVRPRAFVQILLDLGRAYEAAGQTRAASMRLHEAYAVATPLYEPDHPLTTELIERIGKLDHELAGVEQ